MKTYSRSARRVIKTGYDRNVHRRLDEKHYHRKRRGTLYAVPAAVFVVVAAVMLWGPFTKQPQLLSVQQASAVSSDREPSVVPLAGSSDEDPAVGYLETYTVAPDYPRILSIGALGVQARVFEVGTDGRNQPQLPKNSYDTGWYNVSALPDRPGAVVISGACSGSVGQGVFRRLGELAKGAKIIVEKGDGTVVVYEVQRVETVAVDAVSMTRVLSPAHGFSEGLNLMGCAGNYDITTNDFAQRVVVFAAPNLTK